LFKLFYVAIHLFTIYGPLQAPPAPTSQVPICVTPSVLLELLLAGDKEPEDKQYRQQALLHYWSWYT
jgi:hypothetical protein